MCARIHRLKYTRRKPASTDRRFDPWLKRCLCTACSLSMCETVTFACDAHALMRFKTTGLLNFSTFRWHHCRNFSEKPSSRQHFRSENKARATSDGSLTGATDFTNLKGHLSK